MFHQKIYFFYCWYTYNGDSGIRFTNKQQENLFLYTFIYIWDLNILTVIQSEKVNCNRFGMSTRRCKN